MSVNINPPINTQHPCRETERGPQKPPVAVHAQNQNQDSKLLKPTVLVASIASIGLTLAHIARAQKIKLIDAKSFSDIFKPKNWNFNSIKYDTKEVFQVASASTAGGLLAGIAMDYQNRKAKIKEGIQQLVGNIMMPVGFATGAAWLFDKNHHKLNFKKQKTQNVVKMVMSLGSLAVGMVAGNVFARKINEVIFGQKHDRKIQIDDLAGQVDDICISATLIAPDNKFLTKVSHFIPAALIVSGYETGTKKASK